MIFLVLKLVFFVLMLIVGCIGVLFMSLFFY